MNVIPERCLARQSSEYYVVTDYIDITNARTIFYDSYTHRASVVKLIRMEIPEDCTFEFGNKKLISLEYLNNHYPKKAVEIPVPEGKIAVSIKSFYDADAIKTIYGTERLASTIARGFFDERATAMFWESNALRKDFMHATFMTTKEQLKASQPKESCTEEEGLAYARGIEHNILLGDFSDEIRKELGAYHKQGKDNLAYHYMRGVFQNNSYAPLQYHMFVQREQPSPVDLRQPPKIL